MSTESQSTILVVDDDPATAELQRRRLTRSGFQVETAADPAVALQKIEQNGVALVVLDYRLAGNRTGLEFYEQLKAGGFVPPTILVTGFSNEALVVQALRAGVNDFVAKSPDYLDYLPHAVRQVLNKAETERKLIESEARKSTMLEAALDAIIMIDNAGRVVEFNPAAEKAFGYSRNEALGRVLSELIVLPANRDRSSAGLHQFLQDDVAALLGKRVEMTAVHSGGAEFPIEFSIVAGGGDKRRMFTAYARDISERKRLETGLHLQQRALEDISEGILFTDPNKPDNPIVFVNPAFEKITGYRAADVLGKNCRFLQGPATDPEAVAEMRRAVAEKRTCHVELVNYRADGRTFWNAVSINPLHDNTGRVTHFIGVLVDVTQRNLLEEQVRQSQKMEAVGRLAGGVAHDFNNILTVILGNAEFARDEVPASLPGLGEKIHEINEAARRAVALTRQLLAFSRKQVLDPKVVSVHRHIENLDKLLRRLIGEDVALETKLNAAADRVRTDPGQFEQIVMNLAVNARDAMPDGGTLMVETANVDLDAEYAVVHPEVRPGRYVRISVSDTGTGIAPDVIAHIFEPFFTTKEIGSGTGLGLATVFGIVKQSDGHIAVYSEPGLGATFNIYLPAVDQPIPDVADRPAVVAWPTGTETILLVEDEDQVRRLALQILESLGYTVLTAANGDEALRVASRRAEPIHGLVTDVVMPGMTGVQVAEKLRTARPEIKVLYVSGYTNDAMIHRGLVQPGTAFLQKPFTKDSLANKVRQVLDA